MRRKTLAAMLIAVLAGIVVTWFGAASALAAPGDVDSAFGSNGVVTSPLGSATDAALQPDGKIVVVGHTRESCGETGGVYSCYSEFLVERYNSDGSLDSTFGTDGIITTGFGSGAAASSVVIEPSGKILVGGSGGSGIALARYNSNGSLDTSFGDGGEVTTAVPGGRGFQSYSGSMVLLPSGKIILGGSTYVDEPDWEPWQMVVARFDADGTLDTSYGTDGFTVGPKGNMYGLTADSEGRVLAAGWSSHYNFAVARYDADGTLDSTFGNGGITELALKSTGSKADSVIVTPSGKILASGYGLSYAVAEFNEDGSPDTSFGGGDGLVEPSFNRPAGLAAATSMALEPDGRIVFAGQWNPSFESSSEEEWAIGRLYANGSPDESFGDDGLITNDIEGTGYENYATGVLLQPDGKIVAVGSSGQPNYDATLLRVLGGSSAPEPTFHHVLVTKTGSGAGSVGGPELNCGVNCGADYEAGESVELEAFPEEDSSFTGWTTSSGDPGTCTGTTTLCEVTASEDISLVAHFDASGSGEESGIEKETGGGSPGETETPSPSSGNQGGTGSSSQLATLPTSSLTPAPAPSKPKPRPLKCRRGFKKQKIHGKARCVKVNVRRGRR